VLRSCKRDEERIALTVDLEAVLPGERTPQHAPLQLESLAVPVRPEPFEQPRRAFDIAEEERHRTRRLLGHPVCPEG
jgi:hypothetical protein